MTNIFKNIGAMMKNEKIAIILTAILISLAIISNISAQTDDSKKIEFSAGYSRTRSRELFEAPTVANGWTIGIAYKIKKRVSVYTESGQDYGKDARSGSVDLSANRLSALGGIRFHLINKTRLTPFVNAGLGYVRFRVTTRLAGGVTQGKPISNLLFAGGGGLDIALNQTRTVSWRTSAEYRRVESGEIFVNNTFQPSDRHAFRFNTGIVFNF
jgi:opacity protein-like surface antigen